MFCSNFHIFFYIFINIYEAPSTCAIDCPIKTGLISDATTNNFK